MSGALLLIFCLLWPAVGRGQEGPGSGSSLSADETLPGDESGDRHVGYYYPAPSSQESYHPRGKRLPQAGRNLRLGFVTGFTTRQLERPVVPDFALFAKGAEAQKLIIIGLQDGRLNNLYRARAVLAQLTAVSRTLPLFREQGIEAWFTFFDLAAMLGFTQITVSDGVTFTHQILLR